MNTLQVEENNNLKHIYVRHETPSWNHMDIEI